MENWFTKEEVRKMVEEHKKTIKRLNSEINKLKKQIARNQA